MEPVPAVMAFCAGIIVRAPYSTRPIGTAADRRCWMVGRLTENRPIIGAKSDRDSLRGIVICYSCRLRYDPATRTLNVMAQPLIPKLLQSALSVRNSCALQLLAITWQSLVSLQVVKNARYTYSEKAGVGGSTPSLATTFQSS